MLKKIWRKICDFYYALAVFYEAIMNLIALDDLIFGGSPILSSLIVILFLLVALAPILGLMWLYDWLCSLF